MLIWLLMTTFCQEKWKGSAGSRYDSIFYFIKAKFLVQEFQRNDRTDHIICKCDTMCCEVWCHQKNHINKQWHCIIQRWITDPTVVTLANQEMSKYSPSQKWSEVIHEIISHCFPAIHSSGIVNPICLQQRGLCCTCCRRQGPEKGGYFCRFLTLPSPAPQIFNFHGKSTQQIYRLTHTSWLMLWHI